MADKRKGLTAAQAAAQTVAQTVAQPQAQPQGQAEKKARGQSDRRVRGQVDVVIYPAWCKGCGICAAFCPEKVIEMDLDGKARAVRQDDCINCGFCELHCPDFAISVRARENPGPQPSARGK